MQKKFIKVETDEAPQAVGPYSQAIVVPSGGTFVFVSGQLPISPKTGKLIEGDIKALTNQVFDNLEAILKKSGASFENIVRMDVFMQNLGDFAEMNTTYGARFSGKLFPARQTIQVAGLPMGSPIEISCIAVI